MMSQKATTRLKRKERKNIVTGKAFIQATFNNTIVTITDDMGNVISWSTFRREKIVKTTKVK